MAESEVAVLRRLIFKESLPGHDHQHRQLYKRFRKQAHDEAEDAAAAMATPTPADEKGLSDLMKLMNVEDFSTFVKDFITSTVGFMAKTLSIFIYLIVIQTAALSTSTPGSGAATYLFISFLPLVCAMMCFLRRYNFMLVGIMFNTLLKDGVILRLKKPKTVMGIHATYTAGVIIFSFFVLAAILGPFTSHGVTVSVILKLALDWKGFLDFTSESFVPLAQRACDIGYIVSGEEQPDPDADDDDTKPEAKQSDVEAAMRGRPNIEGGSNNPMLLAGKSLRIPQAAVAPPPPVLASPPPPMPGAVPDGVPDMAQRVSIAASGVTPLLPIPLADTPEPRSPKAGAASVSPYSRGKSFNSPRPTSVQLRHSVAWLVNADPIAAPAAFIDKSASWLHEWELFWLLSNFNSDQMSAKDPENPWLKDLSQDRRSHLMRSARAFLDTCTKEETEWVRAFDGKRGKCCTSDNFTERLFRFLFGPYTLIFSLLTFSKLSPWQAFKLGFVEKTSLLPKKVKGWIRKFLEKCCKTSIAPPNKQLEQDFKQPLVKGNILGKAFWIVFLIVIFVSGILMIYGLTSASHPDVCDTNVCAEHQLIKGCVPTCLATQYSMGTCTACASGKTPTSPGIPC